MKNNIISELLSNKSITIEEANSLINQFPNRIDIIDRLFKESMINGEQAVILLKSDYSIPSFQMPYEKPLFTHYDFCFCNPKNGGNGVCNCTLNGPTIYCCSKKE